MSVRILLSNNRLKRKSIH